jgi:hypothetical protein
MSRLIAWIPPDDLAPQILAPEIGGGRPSTRLIIPASSPFIACIDSATRFGATLPDPCSCGRKWTLYASMGMAWCHYDAAKDALVLAVNDVPCSLSISRAKDFGCIGTSPLNILSMLVFRFGGTEVHT